MTYQLSDTEVTCTAECVGVKVTVVYYSRRLFVNPTEVSLFRCTAVLQMSLVYEGRVKWA